MRRGLRTITESMLMAGRFLFLLSTILFAKRKVFLQMHGFEDFSDINFFSGSVTAFNAKMENVSCSPMQYMVVKSADYGDFDNNGVFAKDQDAKIDTQCSALTNCQVKSRCGGQRSCDLTINNKLLPSEHCPDISKEIYTKYICTDKESQNIITGIILLS